MHYLSIGNRMWPSKIKDVLRVFSEEVVEIARVTKRRGQFL